MLENLPGELLTLADLGWPVLPQDVRQDARNRASDRAIAADRAALGTVEDIGLMVGWYEMPDGRLVHGMNELELKAFARESWRLQRLADIRLELVLEAQRPAAVAPPSSLQNRLFE